MAKTLISRLKNTILLGTLTAILGCPFPGSPSVTPPTKPTPPSVDNATYFEIKGQLQSIGDNTGHLGHIKITDSKNNQLSVTNINPTSSDTTDIHNNKIIYTDASGNFDIKVQKTDNLIGMILKAEAGTVTSPTSFVRTLSTEIDYLQYKATLLKGDNLNLIIEVAPLSTLFSASQLIDYMIKTATPDSSVIFPSNPFQKYGVRNLEILASNPIAGDNATFVPGSPALTNLQAAYNALKNKIGLNIQDDTQLSSPTLHYSINTSEAPPIIPEAGWAIIVPDDGSQTINRPVPQGWSDPYAHSKGGTWEISRGTQGVNIDRSVTFLYNGNGNYTSITKDVRGILHATCLRNNILSQVPYSTILLGGGTDFDGSQVVTYPIDDAGISISTAKTYVNYEPMENILGTNF